VTNAPRNLRANGLVNPLGLTQPPRLSWWVDDDRTAEIQTAYEIEAASREELLHADEADLWQSGVISDSSSTLVAYAGHALLSEQCVWWRVRTYDSDGLVSRWSESATFEMGLLGIADWQGHWVSPFVHGNRFHGSAVARIFHEFDLPEDCARARLYLGVVGACQVVVNNTRVTKEPLGTWLDYTTQHCHEVVDVSGDLNHGRNCLEIMLGDGYACGLVPGLGREIFTERPAVYGMLVVEGASTRRYVITSGPDWSWLPSTMTDAQTLTGEHMDGRRVVEEWLGAEVGHLPVQVLNLDSVPSVFLTNRQGPILRIVGEPVRKFARSNLGGQLRVVAEYDAGGFVVGAVRIELVGRDSDAVEIVYSLDRDFNETTKDLITTAGSRSSECYQASFARHAFRYIRVRYTQGVTLPGEIKIVEMSDSTFFTGRIETDNEDINALLTRIDATHAAVADSAPLHGVRLHSRLPDLGQESTWGADVLWNPDRTHLVDKWLVDAKSGFQRYTDSAPYSGGRLSMPRDTDEIARFESLVSLIWARYERNRNVAGLGEMYAELRTLALGARQISDAGLRSNVREDLYGAGADGVFVANCTHLAALGTFLKIVTAARQDDDIELIKRVFRETSEAFKNHYLAASGRLVRETQATILGALVSQVLEPSESRRLGDELSAQLQRARFKVEVPPVLTRYLLPVLSDHGRNDLAYRVLLSHDPDSWVGFARSGLGIMGRNGEASVAEAGILDWILRYLIGVSYQTPQGEGRHAVRIAPHPPLGPQFLHGAPISSVACQLPLPSGELSVRWHVGPERFELFVRIPVNCMADIEMPDGSVKRVTSGMHRLVMDFSAGADGVPTLLDAAGRA
jgi:alpha-L-rhamnosidase